MGQVAPTLTASNTHLLPFRDVSAVSAQHCLSANASISLFLQVDSNQIVVVSAGEEAPQVLVPLQHPGAASMPPDRTADMRG